MAKISYTKTNWVNNETKLNAANMNHIEDGILAATNAAISITYSTNQLTPGVSSFETGTLYLVYEH